MLDKHRSIHTSKTCVTSSGIEVERCYTPDECDTRYKEKLGFPGEFPYTRGIHRTMYRGRLWTMRQYAGFGTARETNRRFKFLLREGQHGLSCAFDLPTQIGIDSDAPEAAGEVGRVGVAIDSLRDMELLFQDIPLDRVSTSMTINAPAPVLLAMYIAVAEKQGVPLDKLSGTVQNDILKEYAARGTYIYPPQESMRLVTDVVEFCTNWMPRFKPISVSGYHMREAGASASQELAFTLANGIAYIEYALARGLKIDQVAPQFSFFLSVHNHVFEEVAKFRAARRLWSRLMRERFGARLPRSQQFRVHAQTGGSTLTAVQPDNNVARVALQSLAAVLGGVQSLHANASDEALALPTEASVRTALRTQQIIAYESGAADTVDPLAGSYFVEELTDQLEQRVQDYLDEIEGQGGAVAAIERGYVQQTIQDGAYRHQQKVERGEEVVVGVNRFVGEENGEIVLHQSDPRLEQRQKRFLQQLRQSRDRARLERALTQLQSAASGNDNVMPFIIDAVKSGATVGEICDTLRETYGEYDPS